MASQNIDYILNLKGNAAQSFRDLGKAADRAFEAIDRTESKAAAAGGKLASLGGVIGGIPVPGFEKLGHVVTAAGDSIEALANPVSAGIVLFAGYGAAVAGVSAAVISLVGNADEWLKQLQEIKAAGNLLDDNQTEDLMQANKTLDETWTQLKRVGVVLAAELAPAVNFAAEGMLGFLGTLERVIQAGKGTGSMIDNLTIAMGGPLSKALLDIAQQFKIVQLNIDAVGTAADEARKNLDAMKDASGSFESRVSGRIQDRIGSLTDIKAGVAAIRGAADRGKGGGGKAEDPLKGRDLGAESELIVGMERTVRGLDEFLAQLDADREAKAAAEAAWVAEVDAVFGEASASFSMLGTELPRMFDRMSAEFKHMNKMMAAQGVMQAKTAEDLVRAIPGIGNFIADSIQMVLNAPDLINSITDSLRDGPKQLGQAIGKVFRFAIPRLIRSIPTILKGLLFDLPFQIAKGIVLGIPRILTSIGRMFTRSLAAVFKGDPKKQRERRERVQNVLDETGLGKNTTLDALTRPGIGLLDRLGIGRGKGFATGGFVDSTGMALVHEGERIIPASGADTGTARIRRQMMGGGMQIGTVNVSVSANNPRDFIRQLRRELGSLGSGATLAAFG